MRTWTTILACIALGATTMLFIHNDSNIATGSGTRALAANPARYQQSTPVRAPDVATSDSEYGWGPVRTTDW